MPADEGQDAVASRRERLAEKPVDDAVHHEGGPPPPRDAGELDLESVQGRLVAPGLVDERSPPLLADPLIEVEAERYGIGRSEVELRASGGAVDADAGAAGEQHESETRSDHASHTPSSLPPPLSSAARLSGRP